jgi:NAD+ kinase
MKHIGIRYNEEKVNRARVDEIAEWLKRNGRKVSIHSSRDTDFPKGMDMLLVMGGDGTLLGGARSAVVMGIPVLGIDFGGLGFLSEIKFHEARSSMKRIFKGEYHLDERLVLETLVHSGKRDRKPMLAVNDVVITKNSGRMLRLKVFINGNYFHEFPGDGLIVSTATGSTAYALSAGGPIISPELDVITLTPICPHTLFARAIVTASTDAIRIELPPGRDDMLLIIDGQEEYKLKPEDVVNLQGASQRARFVRVTGPRFFETVREKFNLT